MPSARSIIYYLFHPQELKAMVQWNTWHNPVHERNPEKETPSLRICFDFLDKTSRSFAPVIKELTPELLVPVALFYLILRGLDTIEDDMSIPVKIKDPLLRDFYKIVEEDGWSFDGCGPDEKDRELLVQFHYVIEEFKKVKSEYRDIIKDITMRMGKGMAENAVKAEENDGISVDTVEDYTKYCHYVAGLVGEGLTRLFVESGLANPVLLKRSDLHESMGQFLQQTNIIRDIREDFEDKRRFWPKAVWSKYVDKFEDLFKKENEDAALRCSSEMVLIALERTTDCMFYMAGIKEQSVFNFVAIPQAMAIATLELCFRNPAIFQRNVKITKGQACQLMLDSSQNLKVLYEPFKTFARRIHKKNDPRDPNFLKISIACGKIEQFIEYIFPSQDPKAIVRATSGNTGPAETPEQAAKRKEDEKDARNTIIYLTLAVFAAVAVMSITMFGVAWLMGARFDLAWQGVPRSDLPAYGESWPRPADVDDYAHLAEQKAHAEL